MCIKEALRLYTPGPFVSKLSSEDVMIHGYRIPKGAYIYTANICPLLELSDSVNFIITIVEIVIFEIMNIITIMDLLNISILNTKIKHGFLKYHQLSQIKLAFL